LGATTVAALTTKGRKDLWLSPCLNGTKPAILTVEGLSPSNRGKHLPETVAVVSWAAAILPVSI